VTARIPSDESVVEAACAALAPYPWRSFTPELIARLVLAASDRESLQRVLVALPGAAVGPWERLVPAGADDPRLAPLVEFLVSHHWVGLRPATLCRNLLGVLSRDLT
jgi:hypothetical protein